MSATRDLIAAALSLADIDEHVAEMPTTAAATVREMCARAMVQPDMAEVERLLEAYDHEYASGGSVEDYDRARTALLDYVRDHFVGCTNMAPVSAAEVPMPDAIGRLYFGGVSCGERDEWEFDADQGVCDRINELATEESRQRVYLHRDVRTYGVQCRAAGYAAGVAAAQTLQSLRELAAEADAALRVEVKP